MMILVDQYIKLIVPEHNSGLLAPPLGPVLGRVAIIEGYDLVAAIGSPIPPPILSGAILERMDSASGLAIPSASLALLHLDGTNGSNTFTDFYGNVWTPVNSATLTTSHFKFGTASLDVQLNHYIVTSTNPSQWAFAGDFTVEMQVYFNTLPSTFSAFLGSAPTTPKWLAFQLNTTNGLNLLASTTLGTWGYNQSSPSSLVTGAWQHIAMVRSGGTITGYVNGVGFGATSFPGVLSSVPGGISIGGDIAQIGQQFDGYIDEIRIGAVARYTSNFTPPSAPFTF